MRYFQFISENINNKFKKDTINRIGPYWLYLVYPEIIVESQYPYNHRASTDVKVDGLHIEEDSYPLFQFLQEHQEFCEPVVKSLPYLNFLFEAWDRDGISPDHLPNT